MAHDNQCKDDETESNRKIIGFAIPTKGQMYWDRDRHRVVEATETMHSPYVIVAKEGE